MQYHDNRSSCREMTFSKQDINMNPSTSLENALHLAATKGNVDEVKQLIENGADVRKRNIRGYTTAHIVVYHARINVLHLLLSHDRSLINLPDVAGNTLINMAALKGHINIVTYLLQEKADLTIRNKYGNTAFHSAAQGRRLKILQTLIKHKLALIDELNRDGNTALHIASAKGYGEIIELLLSKGAKFQRRNKVGKTPIQVSSPQTLKVFRKFRDYNDIISRCHSGMASLLANKRYDDENTALHIVASFSGHTELITQLVSNGARVNTHNILNQTPLYLAVLTENIMNVKTLVACGGRVDDPEYERGQTALHVASLKHDLDILKVLTRRATVDVNLVDKDGKTPLSYAVVHQSRASVQHLLERGADAGLKDQLGQTVLHLSVLTKNTDITEDLLSVMNETTVNEKNVDGQTPLMFAVDRQSLTLDENTVRLINVLLENGADPYQVNNDGASAHSLATEKGFDITTKAKLLQSQ